MNAREEREVLSLKNSKMQQATILGDDLLVSFSDGTSAVLLAADIIHLANASAKLVVTDEEVFDYTMPDE